MALRKIVSGGQTGADRAALEAARAWGTPLGGWVPSGRAAEDGPIPPEFVELRETEGDNPDVRTERNVRDSDGTFIVSHGRLSGGSDLTLRLAQRLRKPVLHLDMERLSAKEALEAALSWIRSNNIESLNVAGPRASEDPGAYAATFAIVSGLLAQPREIEPVSAILLTESWNNFRHWDNLRWAVPSWFISLAAGLMAITGVLGTPETRGHIRYGALALGFFGCLCLLLQHNLIKYHNDAIRTIRRILGEPDPSDRASDPLPFEFSWRRGWYTATAWLIAAMVVTTVMCFYIWYVGPWWLSSGTQ